MILIADSGATKTDWCFGTSLSNRQTIHTEGINPFHTDKTNIEGIIRHQLIPQLLDTPLPECTAIYFYGAGCIPERTEGIENVLKACFPRASVHISTDLLGAARSLCQREPGIACILGTGSNSCLYDGMQIIDNISPLGYILGDEGSGAYLGKRFLGDCLKRQLPIHLTQGLMERYRLTVPDILEKVYRQPQANRFLANLTPYIYENRKIPEVKNFLKECFTEFFKRNVLLYNQTLPVSFTGSLAWFFQEEIRESAQEQQLPVGQFIKNPISGLAVYHFHL